MRRLSPLENALYVVGAVLMVAGAGAYVWCRTVACVLYVVGVSLFVAMQFLAAYDGASPVVRRLRRQQLFGLFCLVASAVAMAMLAWDLRHGSFSFRYVHSNEWVVLLAIGALVQLYAAFRIPAELGKELENEV